MAPLRKPPRLRLRKARLQRCRAGATLEETGEAKPARPVSVIGDAERKCGEQEAKRGATLRAIQEAELKASRIARRRASGRSGRQGHAGA